MEVTDLAFYGEDGYLLNSSLLRNEAGDVYKYFKISHKRISTDTVGTINLYMASFYDKFLADDNVYTSRFQVFNERGFTFYGTTMENWIPVKNLRLLRDPFNIREMVELTLTGQGIQLKKGQIFKMRIKPRPGAFIDPKIKKMIEGEQEQNYTDPFFVIHSINRKRIYFFNKFVEKFDLREKWLNNFDLEIKIIGAIEFHDFFSLSYWNEADFYLRWDLQKSEMVGRPLRPVNFNFEDRFFATGEKYIRSRPVWRLNILEIRDNIFKDVPLHLLVKKKIRLRIHEWKTIEGAGSSICKLLYHNPTTKDKFYGIICRNTPQNLSYGDWIWLKGTIKIKNITYKLKSDFFGKRIKISHIDGNTIIFDKIIDVDFEPLPTERGELPDPADFKDAVRRGRIRFSFSRVKTIEFIYESSLRSTFLNDSLLFFNNLRDIQLKKYDIWVEIAWPYIFIDPRGSYNDSIISFDIDGEPIFGFNPYISGPEFFRYADYFFPDKYPTSQILKGNTFLAVCETTYKEISNHLPYNENVVVKKIKIKHIGPDGNLTIHVNDKQYSYSSNEFNLSDRVNQWYLVWKDFFNTQLGIIVRIDTSETYPILTFSGKYPSVDFSIFLDESHQASIHVFSIFSLEQILFPTTFGIRFGSVQRSVDVSDISSDSSLDIKEKTEAAFQRFVTTHGAELALSGWELIIKNPYEEIVEAGPDINEVSLEIWSSILLNPSKVELLPKSRGWFKEFEILTKPKNFQAIVSNKIFRKTDGFSFLNMQIKFGDRILLENSMFKMNNQEMIVEKTTDNYLIVSSLLLFDQQHFYYRPYVLPFYFVDEEYVTDPDPNFRNFNENLSIDRVSLYLLDRFFYPQTKDGYVIDKLQIRWENEETEKKFFLIDLYGDSLEGNEIDRIKYTGRKPLYKYGVKRKIFLIDKYNKNPKRGDNPYFQQTEFQFLVKELLPLNNNPENWQKRPLHLCLGFRSKDEVIHKNTLLIEKRKPIHFLIEPSKKRNEDFKFTWSINNNRLICFFLDFERIGFSVGDKVLLKTALKTNHIPDGETAKNTEYIGLVKNVTKHSVEFLNLNPQQSLINEESITLTGNNIEIKTVEIFFLPTLLAKIEVLGECEAEDYRYEIVMRNLGIPLKGSDMYAFKHYDDWEWGFDYNFINKKRAEMLINRREIWDYVGSYKSLINSLKFFGHHKMYIWNWSLNLDEKSRSFKNWQRIEIIQVEQTTGRGWKDVDKDYEPPLPTPRWVRNHWVHYVWPRTDENGKFTKIYTEREEILMLGQLKKWQINNIIPIQNELIDISSWSRNPWSITTYNENIKVFFKEQKSSCEAVRFKVEAYLSPISKNDHSYICSIRFEEDNQHLEKIKGFWLCITTYAHESGWKGKRAVQIIKEYRRTFEPYNFVMDWEIDPYAQITTITEDPLTGLRAINRRNIEIYSRATK